MGDIRLQDAHALRLDLQCARSFTCGVLVMGTIAVKDFGPSWIVSLMLCMWTLLAVAFGFRVIRLASADVAPQVCQGRGEEAEDA